MPKYSVQVSGAEVLRTNAAFGKYLGLMDNNGIARSATDLEVTSQIAVFLTQIVFEQERAAASAVAMSNINPITPNPLAPV